jgi:hypothetical protein
MTNSSVFVSMGLCVRFLLLSVVIAVLGFVLPSHADAQIQFQNVTPPSTASTIWTITVDVSSKSREPVYTVTCYVCNCNWPQNHARNVRVCPGDEIAWYAITQPNGSPQSSDMYISQRDDLLVSSNLTALPTTLHQTNGVPLVGGKVGGVGATIGTHKYYVVIYDNADHHIYVDDPEITISTPGPIQVETSAEQLADIERTTSKIRDSLRHGPAGKQQTKELTEDLLNKAQQLNESLDAK